MQNNIEDTGLVAGLLDFGFSRFITLSVVKVLYLLGLALIALTWLIMVISAFTNSAGMGLATLVIGSVAAVIYAVLWRVGLELIVVIFRIGENTSKMVAVMAQPSVGP